MKRIRKGKEKKQERKFGSYVFVKRESNMKLRIRTVARKNLVAKQIQLISKSVVPL